jgi:hypothetical protein
LQRFSFFSFAGDEKKPDGPNPRGKKPASKKSKKVVSEDEEEEEEPVDSLLENDDDDSDGELSSPPSAKQAKNVTTPKKSGSPKKKRGGSKKAKTPKKLAAGEAKAELLEKAKQFVSFSGFDWNDADVEFHRQILSRFELADLEDASDARVKVLVVKNKKRTIKVLQAIARGLCIVDETWLNESVEHGKLLKPENKMVSFFPGAKLSRTINLEKEPRVFEEKRLYLPAKTRMNKDVLEWLVLECGGQLVRNETDADYEGVSEKWLLDAIENYQVPDSIY